MRQSALTSTVSLHVYLFPPQAYFRRTIRLYSEYVSVFFFVFYFTLCKSFALFVERKKKIVHRRLEIYRLIRNRPTCMFNWSGRAYYLRAF